MISAAKEPLSQTASCVVQAIENMLMLHRDPPLSSWTTHVRKICSPTSDYYEGDRYCWVKWNLLEELVEDFRLQLRIGNLGLVSGHITGWTCIRLWMLVLLASHICVIMYCETGPWKWVWLLSCNVMSIVSKMTTVMCSSTQYIFYLERTMFRAFWSIWGCSGKVFVLFINKNFPRWKNTLLCRDIYIMSHRPNQSLS